jgi:hypothetical protein
LKRLWEYEIRGLHSFFEAWYRGDLPNTQEAFSRVTDVIAPEFALITAGGFEVARAQLLEMLRAEHGARPDLQMEVKRARLRLETGDAIVATYEEHGTTAGNTRATLITAVFRRCAGTPNELEWIHIHEVQLP